MGEIPGPNPETMRKTDASQATIVVEANEVVFQAATAIHNQETNRFRQSSFAKAAGNFLQAGYEIVRFPKKKQ